MRQKIMPTFWRRPCHVKHGSACPGAVLAPPGSRRRAGISPFYVAGMTAAWRRVMRGGSMTSGVRSPRAFGHALPSVVAEMRRIGTVAASWPVLTTSAGRRRGRARPSPDQGPGFPLGHRLLSGGFRLRPVCRSVVLAGIAGVEVPIARSLLQIGQTAAGRRSRAQGRTAERMGIADWIREAYGIWSERSEMVDLKGLRLDWPSR